jgi:phosphoribosylaminoimidazole-succinocarboxamide synthase
MNKLYEGKAKALFEADNPDHVIVEFKDDFTAFDGTKRDSMDSKGVINAEISNVVFRYLEKKGIPTHLVEFQPPRIHLCKKVRIIPIEVVVRNIVAGSLSKMTGIAEGTVIKQPIIQFHLKDDSLHDPLVCREHILAFDWATEYQLNRITELSHKINEAMKEFFLKINLRLVDFKLEFGDFKGEVILADEWSPDTCRLWDTNTNEKMDKDRFRRDMGGVMEAYKEVIRRINESQN